MFGNFSFSKEMDQPNVFQILEFPGKLDFFVYFQQSETDRFGFKKEIRLKV